MPAITRTTFLKLLTKQLFPVLKAEGFEGSGQTLRRIRGPVVHVFNVQAASGGKACYLNLGAHFDFLPGEGGSFVPTAEIEEAHCIFRDRIDPPPGEAFGWAYGADSAQAEETSNSSSANGHGRGTRSLRSTTRIPPVAYACCNRRTLTRFIPPRRCTWRALPGTWVKPNVRAPSRSPVWRGRRKRPRR